MGSQWFDLGVTKMNGYDRDNSTAEKIDLTLKLGLPAETSANKNENPTSLGSGEIRNPDFDQTVPLHANLDINDLYSHEGINQNKLKNIASFGQSFNANEVAWPPSGSHYSHLAPVQNLHQSSHFSPFPSSLMGSIPTNTKLNYYHQYPYNNNNSNFNINPNNYMAAAVTTQMNSYTLLDVPSRRVHRELGINIGSSSSSSDAAAASALSRRKATVGGGIRKQHGGGFIDPSKRCTNYYCKTNDTPMWRRGPLGPKTLCNACGIKYRKEEEKRKAKAEAAAAAAADKSNSEDSNTSIG